MGPWARFVENLSSKLAFFPPTPSSYHVKEHKDGTGELYIQPVNPDYPCVLKCKVSKIKTKPNKQGGGGFEIVAAYYPCRHKIEGERGKLTILYSHGNAVDLGQMLPIYRDLSRALKVNVMGYDYSGYGCCEGTPTVSNTLADIQAVYDCLLNDYGLSPFNIVLYGQSVGTGPTVALAAKAPQLAGVILHSPLMSGIRVLSPGLRWWPSWADVYPNHLLVPKIESPLLVMHGTEDEVIHISCGQRLHELSKNKFPPLWAHGYTHQNVEMSPDYLPKLQEFIARVGTPDVQPATVPPGGTLLSQVRSPTSTGRTSSGTSQSPRV